MLVYSYYSLGLKHEEIDFVRDRKLIIAIYENERELIY